MSQYFEDFRVDSVYRSRARTITEADVVSFAGLSGDYSELHTNAEYAKSSVFGERIAHGALVFSISTGLTVQMDLINDTVVAFYGIDTLRFIRPVLIHDTLSLVKRVAEAVPNSDQAGLLTFETIVSNQRQEPVLAYWDKLLLRRRPNEPAAPGSQEGRRDEPAADDSPRPRNDYVGKEGGL